MEAGLDSAKSKIGILFFIIFTSEVSAVEGCPRYFVSERLADVCLVKQLENIAISSSDYSAILIRLNKKGEALGGKTIPRKPEYSVTMNPLFGYNSNTNGGNPVNDIFVNGMKLEGNKNSIRRGGLTAGMRLGLDASIVLAPKLYISYNSGYQLEKALNSSDTIKSSEHRLCNHAHLVDNYYLDACASKLRHQTLLRSTDLRIYKWEISKIFSRSLDLYEFSLGHENSAKFSKVNMHASIINSGTIFKLGYEASQDSTTKSNAISKSLSLSGEKFGLDVTYYDNKNYYFFGDEYDHKIITLSPMMKIGKNGDFIISYSRNRSKLKHLNFNEFSFMFTKLF